MKGQSLGLERIDEMLQKLSDPDSLVRSTAAELLGCALPLSDSRVVPALINSLKDQSSDVRSLAAQSLRDLGAKEAIEPILEMALFDSDQRVAFSALLALPSTRDPIVIERCLGALQDPREEVRKAATSILGEQGGDRAVEPLLALLRDPSYWVRSVAARSLGRIGNVAAVPLLIESLSDPKSYVRECVVGALGELKDARAIDPLVALFQTPGGDFNVKRHCIKAMGSLGGEKAVVLLCEALQMEPDFFRIDAAESLGVCKDKRAVEALIKALEDSHSWVRSRAAQVLGEIGDSRAVAQLLSRLSEPDQDCLYWVIQSLGKLGDSQTCVAIFPFLLSDDLKIRVMAIQALRDQKECKVVDYFQKVLESNDSGMRKKVIEQLGFFMDAKALDILTSALADEDSEIRQRAAESLGVMKDTRATDFLWSSFEKEPVERVRLSLAWALQQLGDRRVIPTIYPILLEELKNPNVMVRTGVLHYLAWIGDKTAVELLRECSKKDEHHWVRLESQKQLEMIAKGTVEHPGISIDLYSLVEYRFSFPLLRNRIPENPDPRK